MQARAFEAGRGRWHRWPACAGFGLLLAVAWPAAAQEVADDVASPRWAYEFRGGAMEPDLDRFEEFYGGSTETYFDLAGSYRFTEWFELGAELGHMKAEGVGLLESAGQLGGEVEYQLTPAQIFANFIWQRRAGQRVVPYLGAGLAVAGYRQKVVSQPTREGRTDLGYSARLGVRFRVLSRGPYTRTSTYDGARYWRGYVFVEAQHLSVEADGTELGGDNLQLGFRMEFDFAGMR